MNVDRANEYHVFIHIVLVWIHKKSEPQKILFENLHSQGIHSCRELPTIIYTYHTVLQKRAIKCTKHVKMRIRNV